MRGCCSRRRRCGRRRGKGRSQPGWLPRLLVRCHCDDSTAQEQLLLVCSREAISKQSDMLAANECLECDGVKPRFRPACPVLIMRRDRQDILKRYTLIRPSANGAPQNTPASRRTTAFTRAAHAGSLARSSVRCRRYGRPSYREHARTAFSITGAPTAPSGISHGPGKRSLAGSSHNRDHTLRS